MCVVVPISRSYFKILEILYKFNIFYDNCYISCIAEGPGGFIQCLHDTYSKKKLNIHSICGITLISDDKRVPYWNTLVTQNKKILYVIVQIKLEIFINLKILIIILIYIRINVF